jgi:mRNA interferase YafQ
MDKLRDLVLLLAKESELPAHNKDHLLTGNWKDHRECHIEPDWLLIYKLDPNQITLVRTGTHADLFAK